MFKKSFLSIPEINANLKIALWMLDLKSPLKPISIKEQEISKSLSKHRSYQFKYSRGYIRNSLSNLFNIDPLKVPIEALPGRPPALPKGWGYLSLSHSDDALLIGWSRYKIGVDIERKNRSFSSKAIVNKYFSKEENKSLNLLDDASFNYKALDLWVKKEAAIKWQEGKLLRDLPKWICSLEKSKAYHSTLKKTINVNSIKFINWYISIASEKYLYKNMIICKD